jgi:2-polyprenyl-3-methyl-5-hydroxy-6-metoxy-1,4-benzoquinol methylase
MGTINRTASEQEGRLVATEAIALDDARVSAFADHAFADLVGTISVALASIGDQLGLFKDLDTHGPASSDELAARAGINERYAREWLSGMACAGYLAYDSATARFRLPPEHAPVLAHENGPAFLGGVFQEIPPILGVIEQVTESFRTGGGVPQSAYHRHLWEGMERETAPIYEHLLVQEWLPEMPDVLAKLQRGATVADIGCGSGRAVIELAQAFPNSRFVGYDAFAPQVARATANAAIAGVADRASFVVLDASQGLPEQFDIITTFDVVHDAVDPAALMRAIRAALKPDGIYILQEMGAADTLEENIASGPLGTFFYGVSVLYCMTTSLAEGGAGLGTAGMPESTIRRMAASLNFSQVRRIPIEDPFHSLFELWP